MVEYITIVLVLILAIIVAIKNNRPAVWKTRAITFN